MSWLTEEEKEYFDLRKAADHDLLVQIHSAIYAKDTGLRDQVTSLRKTLQGNGTVGLVETVRNHSKAFETVEEDRKKFRNRIYLAILFLVPFLTVLFDRLINWWGK